eukprot:GILJ01009495.1.p1 GENE.GILJ01009495.1~~GILJ01009495.1.p1  ORF type:complete len:1395 (+),score=268.10 GILJ01009495.1:46-4230(+)
MFSRKKDPLVSDAAPAADNGEGAAAGAAAAGALGEVPVDPKTVDPSKMTKPLYKIKKGDYLVHVHLLEARGLVGKNLDGTSDALCKVSCFGQTKTSRTLKGVGPGATVWNEHFFFNAKEQEVDDIEAGKINFTVFDSNSIFRNTVIGSFDLDLTHVYYLKDHSLARAWLGLVNTSGRDHVEQLQGRLKASVAVLGPGDEENIMDEYAEEDEGPLILPPSIRLTGHQLKWHIYRAEDLPKMDVTVLGIGAGIDAFVSVEFAGKKKCETKIQKSLTPVFNESLYMPVSLPVSTDNINIRVWDRDVGSADDLVGSHKLKFKKIQNQSSGPFWVNLYGAQAGVEGKNADRMNRMPEHASAYKGRLLMGYDSVNDKKPVLKVEPIRDVPNAPADVTYILRAQIHNGQLLPSPGAVSKVAMTVMIGNHSVSTAKVSLKNGVANWFENLPELELLYPDDIRQVPDVFVYYTLHMALGDIKGRSTQHVCFKRFSAAELLGFDKPADWHWMLPDEALDKVERKHKGGVVCFRVGLFNANVPAPRWETNIRPPVLKYELRSYIYQARDLPAADASGVSDPLISVFCNGLKFETPHINGTTSPEYYLAYKHQVELPLDLALAPPVIVNVYDHDVIGENDFLGRAVISFERIVTEFRQDGPPVPVWIPIAMNFDETAEGQVLLAFQLVPAEYAHKVPMNENIRPLMEERVVEITCLGLRDLENHGLVPIKKPFMEFDIGNRDETDAVIKTAPSCTPSSVNPNIHAVIPVTLLLPVDPLFAPSINCRVYDHLFGGISTPLLGTFTVHLEEAVKKLIQAKQNQVRLQAQQAAGALPPSTERTPLMQEFTSWFSSPSVVRSARPVSNELELMESRLTIPTPAVPARRGYSPLVEDLSGPLPGQEDSMVVAARERGIPLGDIEVGFGSHRHVRKLLDNELEDTGILGKTPFDQFTVYRGQTRGLLVKTSDRVRDSAGQVSNRRGVGKFKGVIRVRPPKEIDEDKSDEKLLREILAPRKFLVRLYVLEGVNIMPKDAGSASDPYLQIKLGKKIFDTKKDFKKNTQNPKFYQLFEIETSLPGDSQLEIAVMDWDPFFTNELIGKTELDLEDRYFSKQWRDLKDKPVENRSLWNPSCQVAQGKLKLWVDILSVDMVKANPPRNISLPPPMKFELRVIVWKTRNVNIQMDVEDLNDLFCKGWVEGMGDDKQETDTHWRCSKGEANWNYRWKIPVMLPMEFPRFNLQLWDRDVLKWNDFMADATVNCKDVFDRAFKNQAAEKLWGEKRSASLWNSAMGNEQRDDKVWIKLNGRSDFTKEFTGEVLLSLEVLPWSVAQSRPNGAGRTSPNQEPWLPPPAGRIKLNFFNPLGFLADILGPKVCRRLVCLVFCGLYIACMIFMLPMITSNLLTNAFTK